MDSANRERKKAWRDEERHRARAAFPLDDAEFGALFDAVAKKLEEQECDDTRRFTEAWAREHSCSLDALAT
jgi:hypothetical protein